MIRKLLGVAAAVALPAVLAAQTPTIPNEHASDKGQAMVAEHSQGAAHRATSRRGEVAGGLAHRPGWIAIPPVGPVGPGARPTLPPTGKATPAQPPHKPASPGQSGNHRP
jgi:hypothetical protein